MIEINIETTEGVTVVHIGGEMDATTSPTVQKQVLALASAGGKIILDLVKLEFMSSAGLRAMLAVYREVSARKGRIVLAAVPEDIKDTMALTGFLGFFDVYDSVAAAKQALTAV